jgi:hypothetical protein
MPLVYRTKSKLKIQLVLATAPLAEKKSQANQKR